MISEKKILIISNEFPPQIGGAGTVAFELASELSRQNYNITVLTLVREKVCSNYPFTVIAIRNRFKLWLISYFFWFMKTNMYKYDHIILNDIGASIVGACFFPEKLLKRCLVFLHGSEPEFLFHKPKFLFKLISAQKKYIRLLRSVGKIVSVSNYMKNKFLTETRLGDLGKKIVICYSGIDEEIFCRKPINIKAKYKIKKDKIVLFSASRILEKKGYGKMYKIFKNIIKVDDSYHWLIAGDGPYKDFLLENIKRDSLENYITFIGSVERSRLGTLYSSVDLFWLLSDFEEAFGLVYIECQSCGTPVVANNIGGVGEAVTSTESGYVVNSNEQCENIILSREYLKLDKNVIIENVAKFRRSATSKYLIKKCL